MSEQVTIEQIITVLEALAIKPNNLVSLSTMKFIKKIKAHGIARHSCSWTPDDEGVYETQCGHTFVFVDGGCSENNANYCQYCGGKVIERDWEQE